MPDKINCIIVDDEPVAREILEDHLSKLDPVNIVASCKNALEAFKVVSTKKVDLVFLDINMPDISGLTFAKSMNSDLNIIFTTAYREYAVEGFDLKAVDYLLKPISFERLLQSVNKYIDEHRQRSESGRIEKEVQSTYCFVRADRKMVKIVFSDIRFVESIGDYLKIHLKEGMVTTRETLQNMEAILPSKDFLRIHRSYLVSLSSIRSFTSECIEVEDRELPVSRGYREGVMGVLNGNEKLN
jgi:DNA-binding LytR/AlgR family response regulator